MIKRIPFSGLTGWTFYIDLTPGIYTHTRGVMPSRDYLV
tara:strand:- start:889 stop:1005 length:117 start_codon:yes stop_codon:yes gene_type:complete